MSPIDPAQEFSRLAGLYSQMADEQLQQVVAEDFADLTAVAQDALRAEFAKRHLSLPEPPKPQVSAAAKQPAVAAPQAARVAVNAPPPPPGAKGLVEIARFRDVPVAAMMKGALESAGIQCFLADDQMINTNWFYSNALGGVKLLVSPADFDAAKEVLEQPIPERIEFAEGEEYEQPRCPKCGSLNVSFQNIDEAAAFSSAWVGIPLPFTLDRWECKDCEATWTDNEDDNGGSQEVEEDIEPRSS